MSDYALDIFRLCFRYIPLFFIFYNACTALSYTCRLQLQKSSQCLLNCNIKEASTQSCSESSCCSPNEAIPSESVNKHHVAAFQPHSQVYSLVTRPTIYLLCSKLCLHNSLIPTEHEILCQLQRPTGYFMYTSS